MVLWGGAVAGQEPVSKFAEELRVQNERTQSVSKELLEMIRQGENDPEVIASVGRRFLAQFDAAIATVETYRKATTRFGLQSEIDDMLQMFASVQVGQRALMTLTDTEPPPPLTNPDMDLVRQMFQEDIVPMIRDFVDRQLGAQGAADFLTDPGFEQAVVIVSNRIGAEVREKVEGELSRIVGARVHLGMSLKDHLLTMARGWVSKSVGGIVLRMAANQFLVERLAVKLLEWVGPRLREFLRPKGNLESRTERAIEGMADRRMDLDRMDSSEELLDVRRHVEGAIAHIKANDYLRGDIQRAKRDDLYKQLAEEEKTLLRVIERTRTRFLMNSPLTQEPFGEIVKELRAAREKTADILANLPKGSPASPGEYDVQAYGTEFKAKFPGRFGLTTAARGDGYAVRVTSPSGSVLADGEFRLARKVSAEEAKYELRDARWSDGTKVPLVEFHVFAREADGTPKIGFITWWHDGLVDRKLVVEFKRGGAGAGSWTLIYDANFAAGSKGTAKDFPGTYTMELSRAGQGKAFQIGFQGRNEVTRYPMRVRVIDPSGKVILNVVLQPSAVPEPGTSNRYIRYDGGPAAWIDGTPVRRVHLGIASGRQNPHDASDNVPNSGTLTWFADEGTGPSSILFSLSFRPKQR